MKKKTIYLLFITLGVVACSRKQPETTPPPAISVAKPEVRNIILTKQYPGYLEAEQTVDLVARVNGTLLSASFTPGSHVHRGQVLFRIEPSIYQDKVIQAEATLTTAEARLEYAQSNYQRMLEAVKSDAVSLIQVQQAKSDVSTSQAEVNNAKAALNSARTELAYCTVRAPFDGTITRSQIDVGSYVNGSAQPVTLATIYKDDILYSYFNVADNQWLLMTAQQGSDSLLRQVYVKTNEKGENSYPAKLDYLSPNIDLQTGTINLRAQLNNTQGKLRSGLYVNITLPYASYPQAILVPESSIGTDQLGKFLYVVNDSGIVHYRPIQVGQLINDTLRHITSGLSPQEQYVTHALLKVREGMQVKAVEQKRN